MKTTKEQTEAFAKFLLKSRLTGRVYLDRVRIGHLLDLIDDIDTLESRLAWAEGLLERAKYYVEAMNSTHGHIGQDYEKNWLADLESGPGGERDE